jgi:5-(carboxyamino)imidazole ribonucleotide mutase
MPNGIPVATVALNGAQNAGILAARILASSDSALLKKIENYMEGLKDKVFESRKSL